MTLDEIKTAIEAGNRVFWVHNGYEVVKDSLGQYLIKYETGHCIGLTHQDGVTLNGKEKEFFTIETKKPQRWKLGRSFEDAYIRNIEDEEGEIIAQVCDLDDFPACHNRALLMAAAPELLDALYLALPFVEDHEGSEVYKPGVVRDAIKTIRAAIRNAER